MANSQNNKKHRIPVVAGSTVEVAKGVLICRGFKGSNKGVVTSLHKDGIRVEFRQPNPFETCPLCKSDKHIGANRTTGELRCSQCIGEEDGAEARGGFLTIIRVLQEHEYSVVAAR